MKWKDGFFNKIAWEIAFRLPDRIVLFAIVRAFSWVSTHECSNKTPEEIGYSEVYKSWEKRFS